MIRSRLAMRLGRGTSARWLRRGLTCAGATLLAIAALEVTLRLLGVHYPVTRDPHPTRGVAYRPDTSWEHTAEGHSHVEINGDGFRDRAHAVPKPRDVLRIAVLGDSYTDALQVEVEERFTELMESRLNASLPAGTRRVEVLNFGQSGYGTGQELLVLREEVWRYEPDYVLLAFFPGNDVRNNSETLEGEPNLPYFVVHGEKLEFDDSFREEHEPWYRAAGWSLARNSRIGQLAYRGYHMLTMRRRSEAERAAGCGEVGLDDKVFAPPVDPTWAEAWAVTERLLETMHREVERGGAAFGVVTVSSAIQVDPDPSIRARYRAAVGVQDLFYADRRVRQLGERRGFEVLELPPLLQRRAEEEHVYLHGFDNTRLGSGHWNAAGHAAAAELIAEWLEPQLPLRR